MANQTKFCPYGPLLPLLPAVILILGLIFSLIRPYCPATSTVAIVLGFCSVILVLLPACIKFRETNQVKCVLGTASVFSAINFIMEAICHNRTSSYVALAFWVVGALVTGAFAANPIKVAEETNDEPATAPGIEVKSTPAQP